MKNVRTQTLILSSVLSLVTMPLTCAEDSHFKIEISGGHLDGKTLTGKVTKIPSRVGITEKNDQCSLTFSQIQLEGSSATANFMLRWKGDSSDGKKEPSYDKNGTPKYGRTGSLVIFDTSENAAFSKMHIDFKDLEMTITDATVWKSKSDGIYEGKKLSASGTVKKSITKVYTTNAWKPDSESDDVTLKFSMTATVSRTQ